MSARFEDFKGFLEVSKAINEDGTLNFEVAFQAFKKIGVILRKSKNPGVFP